jgi:hypothetical protein
MSLEGGLEELEEFFWAAANLASKTAIRASKDAITRSRDSQRGHELWAGASMLPAI